MKAQKLFIALALLVVAMFVTFTYTDTFKSKPVYTYIVLDGIGEETVKSTDTFVQGDTVWVSANVNEMSDAQPMGNHTYYGHIAIVQ